MDDSIPERYEVNPLLVYVENYVLDAIGELGEEKVKLLGESVAAVFGGTALEWKKTLRKTFDLPGTTDQDLVKLWKQRREEADAMQETVTAEDFAREVADEMDVEG